MAKTLSRSWPTRRKEQNERWRFLTKPPTGSNPIWMPVLRARAAFWSFCLQNEKSKEKSARRGSAITIAPRVGMATNDSTAAVHAVLSNPIPFGLAVVAVWALILIAVRW